MSSAGPIEMAPNRTHCESNTIKIGLVRRREMAIGRKYGTHVEPEAGSAGPMSHLQSLSSPSRSWTPHRTREG
ncbi:hypothetical protein BHE74_00010748 [Ensete ventricosum]|nr:hypothetical protein GW17_00010431 [Ensete ventricosum]RWW80891.1 hypothetical protein BHE74_00010748 [Ensete ventricosum]